uniref:KRAB domain-containing protein n=1 Tax=Cyanistes caeruleus TaxID=156563 RepID=A0A8C0UDU1_CYACU
MVLPPASSIPAPGEPGQAPGLPEGRSGAPQTPGPARSFPCLPQRRAGAAGSERPSLAAAAVVLQVPVLFEDVAVRFSRQEWWDALPERRRQLYRDVVLDTYELLTSLGEDLCGAKEERRKSKHGILKSWNGLD